MDVSNVLHMNGGFGDNSYASNSVIQRKVMAMTKAIIEEAVTGVYGNMFLKTICIADLGCSSGPNTLFVATEVMKTVDKIRRKFGHKSSPEFQIFLNDLPGNDFNSIFRSLPRVQEELRDEMGSEFGPCFFTGLPGSFYSRLCPIGSLHFVHSSYSLMWLSQVPKGVEMNKENIYLASTSPSSVIQAYYEQFQKDFSMFLKCRSEELVSGGRMVLTILGRKSDDPTSKECCYIWDLLAMALKQMVYEGLIEQEKLYSFSIPQYTPSPFEVKAEVEKEGSFAINHLEASEINWAACGNKFNLPHSFNDDGYNVAKCIRSVAEPLLIDHFGESIMDKLFLKYGEILSDCMSKEETKFVNVTISMTKKE
ncbi:salicylate carboxymethyltransferase-like [Olea europaea subsp. europaea]|uniref:Salicylate carboxymethyltransferase-like n=1 Tax=Olea europaea subsp. europaea TaxID=158383 RepID=A0A8S0UQ24_OLEEU|nr:salicylate carboxymethyltransferase-like [Olea europaea subsp. europaea]